MNGENNRNSSDLPQPEILTLQQVSEWLQIEPRQVVRFGVPCVRLGHRTLRFLRDDVLAWLKEREAKTPTPNKRGSP